MGGEQAASVLHIVEKEKKTRAKLSWSEEDQENFKSRIKEKYDTESEAMFASARLWDDGIIDPADTRKVLGLSFAAAIHGRSKSIEGHLSSSNYGVFRM